MRLNVVPVFLASIAALCIAPVGRTQPQVPARGADDGAAVKLLVLQPSDFPVGWRHQAGSDKGWKCLEIATVRDALVVGSHATACAASFTFQLSNGGIRVGSQAALFKTRSEAENAFEIASSWAAADALGEQFKQGMTSSGLKFTDIQVTRSTFNAGDKAARWLITVRFTAKLVKPTTPIPILVRFVAILKGRAVVLGLVSGNLPESVSATVISRLVDRVEGKSVVQTPSVRSLPSKAAYTAWRKAFATALLGSNPKDASETFLFEFVTGHQKLIDDLTDGRVDYAGAAVRARNTLSSLVARRPLLAGLPNTHPTLAALNKTLLEGFDYWILAYKEYVIGFTENKQSALVTGDKKQAQGTKILQDVAYRMLQVGEQVGVPG